VLGLGAYPAFWPSISVSCDVAGGAPHYLFALMRHIRLGC
jgi:hypothetical protein